MRQRLLTEARHAYHALNVVAHKMEHPMHFIYFVLVFVSAKGPYGIAAGACAFIILLARDEHPSA